METKNLALIVARITGMPQVHFALEVSDPEDLDRVYTDVAKGLEQGNRGPFREVIGMSHEVEQRVYACPGCGQVIPAGTPVCPHCNSDMNNPIVQQKLKANPPQVSVVRAFQQIALITDSSNRYMLNVNCIACWDIVPRTSPAWEAWVDGQKIADEIREQRKLQISGITTATNMKEADALAEAQNKMNKDVRNGSNLKLLQ